MPTLHAEDGVEICMYFFDHNPPHVHAFHADEEVLLVIRTGAILDGSMRANKLAIAKAYVAANVDALLARWDEYSGGGAA